MLTAEETRIAPSVHVRVVPGALAEVVVEGDEVPRRSARKFMKKLFVGRRVCDAVSHIERVEGVVPALFVVENQDPHDITPHSFGPIV
jgi:hypothetical protein